MPATGYGDSPANCASMTRNSRLRRFLRCEFHEFIEQLIARFDPIRIKRNAIDGTHFAALRGIVMPHAFGAFPRIDFIYFNALRYGLIRAFRLANIAIDALIGDLERHASRPLWRAMRSPSTDERIH